MHYKQLLTACYLQCMDTYRPTDTHRETDPQIPLNIYDLPAFGAGRLIKQQSKTIPLIFSRPY